MALLTLQEDESETAAEVRREEAARFIVRDVVAGLGRAIHYCNHTNDAKLARVAIDFIRVARFYTKCDEFVERAKVPSLCMFRWQRTATRLSAYLYRLYVVHMYRVVGGAHTSVYTYMYICT